MKIEVKDGNWHYQLIDYLHCISDFSHQIDNEEKVKEILRKCIQSLIDVLYDEKGYNV